MPHNQLVESVAKLTNHFNGNGDGNNGTTGMNGDSPAANRQVGEDLQLQPIRYTTVPPSNSHTRLGVPSGRTVINFETGEVNNENESGAIVSDVKTREDMAEELDIDRVQLRSIYAVADVPCHMQLDDGDWFELDACNYYPLRARDFRTVTFKVGVPYSIDVRASNRADPTFDVSGVSVHGSREGQFPSGGGTTQQDSYADVVWQPQALSDSGRIGDFSKAKGVLHTVSFGRNTFTIENDSGNGNAIDARVVSRRMHPGSGTYFQVSEKTNIADGNHVVFNLTEASHFMKVQVRNNTNGNAISANGQYTGSNP